MNWVEVSGARIRYHETGPSSGPPIVLLHGIGRSLEDWEPQHSRLPPTHRVVSLDMPGFGLSQRLGSVTTLASLAAGVWATLAALAIDEPADLMGNSLGGAVAMRMAVDRPGRVRTLTLVNSAGFGRTVTPALRLLTVPGVGRPLLRRMADPRIARRAERSIFFDRAMVTAARLETATKIARQPDFAAVYLEAARALGGMRGVAPRWRRELLPQVAALHKPTLLVWGSHDLILPSAHLEAARLAFPAARWHLFPDTGHMPQLERPDEFAALVQPLLDPTPPSPASPPASPSPASPSSASPSSTAAPSASLSTPPELP